MIRTIDIRDTHTLQDYGAHLHLARTVYDLRSAAGKLAGRLKGRTVWMLNSTEEGGGIAEMLPKIVSLLRDLGVDTQWVVVGSEDEAFFHLTKRIHNMLHGTGNNRLRSEDRSLYASVSREAANLLKGRIGRNDIVVTHDPQPLGVGALLKEELGVPAIWRCHVGLDSTTPQTQAAWKFLEPWVLTYDKAVFTFSEYVPPLLSDRAEIISPAIDPLSDKNRELSIRKVAGVLSNARLDGEMIPVVTPEFESPAMRLQEDGTFAPASRPEPIGLLHRPIVSQISRWDRLKGWSPLLRGFERLKSRRGDADAELSEQHRRRLDLVRLVLAGPDPSAIQDDPEGLEVFHELREQWLDLPRTVQRDVALLVLPMGSRRINALMVNALQRCSSIVVQNSIQEGFGLTVTEAMWKRSPVMGTRAVGIRNQLRDGVDGRLVIDPTNPGEVATVLNDMLASPDLREEWGHNAEHRVAEHFLIFTQVLRWLRTIAAASAGDAQLLHERLHTV